MASITPRERISVLLNLLGPEVADNLLEQLPPDVGDALAAELRRMREAPPHEDDVDDVLEEFLRVVNIASAENSTEVAEQSGDGEEGNAGSPEEYLRTLPPLHLVAAFQGESPRTVAIVMNTFPEGLAAQVLENLPDEQREGVFSQLKSRPKVSTILLQKLLEATAEKARGIGPEQLSADNEDVNARLARVLKTMKRRNREQILAGLEQRDPETATAIRMSMYTFADLPSFTDKALQKLLAALDQQTLSAGLVRADTTILDCVLTNLSRRAKEVLKEEMDLLGTSVDEESVQEARKKIMAAVVDLDQRGELALREG